MDIGSSMDLGSSMDIGSSMDLRSSMDIGSWQVAIYKPWHCMGGNQYTGPYYISKVCFKAAGNITDAVNKASRQGQWAIYFLRCLWDQPLLHGHSPLLIKAAVLSTFIDDWLRRDAVRVDVTRTLSCDPSSYSSLPQHYCEQCDQIGQLFGLWATF